MDDAMWTVSVLAFLFLLAVEVIYYGFGSAIQNLNLNQLKEEAEEKGGKKSRQILQLAEIRKNTLIQYSFWLPASSWW